MQLLELKKHLKTIDTITIKLPDGSPIPAHFHITEIGLVTKNFIDCGGRNHIENLVTMQARVAGDIDHRLTPEKLLRIITVSSRFIDDETLPVELEYQGDTIQRYQLDFVDSYFQLQPLYTNCLAQDKCGISPSQLPTDEKSCCAGGCC